MKREKQKVLVNISETQMTTALADYARADAEMERINTELDEQFTELRRQVADRLQELSDTRSASLEVVQAFAMENRESLFAKKKSMETAHGVIGFRTGTPKLKTLPKFTWAAVTMLLKEFLPGHVRVVTEPAKDKLLADRDDRNVYTCFAKCGIEVVQDETFYVELKKEETN
jgi:phage host-nuclease inhibitor protein Gam